MAFKMKGFSPFTKNGDDGKSTPGAIAAIEKISKENPNIDKIGLLEGEMNSIIDNDLQEAMDDGDKQLVAKLKAKISNIEKQIASLK